MNLFNTKVNGLFMALSLVTVNVFGQESFDGRKFEQMGTMLPTPNSYRTASGGPGHEYWQQKADYLINVVLDEEKQTLSGYEEITYTNNSPDQLSYLWLQLEQNMRNTSSDTYSSETSRINQDMSEYGLKRLVGHNYDLGYNILQVRLPDADYIVHGLRISENKILFFSL